MEMPIPADWNGEDCCKWVVYWPDSPKWQAILSGLIEMPSQGRFWDGTTGSIVDTQNSFRPFYDLNFNLEEVLVGCRDSGLLEGLALIASAIAQSGGALGSGGASGCGCVTPNVGVQIYVDTGGALVPVMGTETPAVLPETGYPVGYDTEGQYLDDKCAKAEKLVTDWTETIRNMGKNNWVVGVLGAAAILACLVGLITVPFETIPILLFALAGNVGITTALIGLANYMDDHHAELVCYMYTGNNTDELIHTMSDFLSIAIGAISVEGALAVALKTVALALLSTDALNYLWTAKAKDGYPTADCSGCASCDRFYTGGSETILSQDETSCTVDSYELGGGTWDSNVYCFMNPFGTLCGPRVQFEDVSTTGSPTIIRFFDVDGNNIYEDSVFPTFPFEAQAVEVNCPAAHETTAVISLL